MPLSLSLPLSARRYTGYEAMPFFEGLLPEDDVREAVARQFHVSAMRPMELIRVLGKIVPAMSSYWKRVIAVICQGRRPMFRSQTPLRKSFATRTAPSPNFARSIAYPLLEAKRRSRFFMTIVLLWTRLVCAIGGSTVEPYHQASDSRSFSASGLQRIYLHGSSAGYGVRSSRDVLS